MKFNISAVISLTLLASLSPAFAQVGDPGESLRPAKLMVLEEAADFVERTQCDALAIAICHARHLQSRSLRIKVVA